MGLASSNSSRKTYLQIISGRFAQKVEKGTPGAVERENKKKVMVYELLHDKLSGKIKEMTITKSDFGEALEVSMEDVGEHFHVSIPVESKYFDSFAAKIGSADLTKEVELAPYSFEPKDGSGKKTGLNIFQSGTKLGYFFSKDDPKGKPQPSAEKLDDKMWKIYKIQERDFYCKYILGMTKPTTSSQPVKAGGASDLPW
jgi:hypothetical protein